MATTPETTQDDSPMRLSVSNFGPIAEADIELRPLTVFVGPSNTGKSYLAILLHTLHRIFSGSFQNIHAQFNGSPSKLRAYSSPFDYSHMLNGESKKIKKAGIIEWTTELPNVNTENKKSYKILPSSVASIVHSKLNAGKYPEDEIFAEIVRCFGVNNMSEIIRHSAKSASIFITKQASHSEEPFEFKLHVSRSLKTFESIFPNENQLQLNEDRYLNLQHAAREITQYVDLNDPDLYEFAINRILSNIVDNVFAEIINPLHLSSHYFPASRTGVMEADHVIKAALYSRISKARAEPIIVPLLSGIISDFLTKMDPTFLSRSRTTALHKHADEIEETVLEGKVIIENAKYYDTPAFFFQQSSTGKSIPLFMASSMVTELAPIILHLRYLIHESDVLIIEEPEAHLHPAKQVEFTRQLASLVQNGIRIIITTHSEWILEALTNIVKISELPHSQRKDLPSKDFSLEPNQVGVWLFKPKSRSKGFIVEPININNESGAFPADYDRVMDALYNEWSTTFNRISDNNILDTKAGLLEW